MNEFIKMLKSPFKNWILIIFLVISTINFFHHSISNANQCASVFKMHNSPNITNDIDTVTDNLVEFFFQSFIGYSEQNVNIQDKESTSNHNSVKINSDQKISGQYKLMAELKKLQYLYGQSAIKLYYQKIKERQVHFIQLSQEFDKKKQHENNEKEKLIDRYNQALPIYWQEKLRFHRIEPGPFMMGEPGEQVETTITKPFAMAATLTTQLVWRKVAELANKRFPGKYNIVVDPSHFKGDFLPVESLSLNDIDQWILALNDLSLAGDRTLFEFIPGYKKHEVYRLPTEAEWEFVIRGRGQLNEDWHIGNDMSKLHDYAWIEINSNRKSHSIAEKLPLEFENMKFFDMHGNVAELVFDTYQSQLKGGIDPVIDNQDTNLRVIRGGHWYSYSSTIRSHYRAAVSPESIKAHNFYFGFRLAKDVN